MKTSTSKTFIPLTTISICVLVMLGALGGWGYMAYSVYSERAVVAGMLAEREVAFTKGDYATTLHSLVRETIDARTIIADFSQTPAASVVQAVQDAADTTRVTASIDAIAPTSIESGTVKKVPALTLAVSARDSFARLYTFMTLLETLPLPMRIESVSFDNEQAGTNTKWGLTMRLSIFTEAAK